MQKQPFWLKNGDAALLLAPMEGVADAAMRAFLTERGGFTACVSEFYRISQDVPPARIIEAHVPEFAFDWKTPSGTPVFFQLLGGDPEKLAQAAQMAIDLGAPGIDINFGCPAPTVCRNDGGSTLLKFPSRIRAIVEAVRKAVPVTHPVSAKLRLGWDSIESIHENADRCLEGGANWITIHGRTKVAGYQPPAYWGPIGEVRMRTQMPVVANGDIFTLDDFKRCRDQTRSEHFMIGRGALADPNLSREIAQELKIVAPLPQKYEWRDLIERFAEINLAYNSGQRAEERTVQRIKQWLKNSHLRGIFLKFDSIKMLTDIARILEQCEI